MPAGHCNVPLQLRPKNSTRAKFCKRAVMTCTHCVCWRALRAAPEYHSLIPLVCGACYARGHVLSCRVELGSMAAGARVMKPFLRVNAGMKNLCTHAHFSPFVHKAWT